MSEAAPTERIPALGLETPFGKARSMVFPRTVLAGHGVLQELGRSCRNFDFPDRGAVITGRHTVELAGRRAGEILAESHFDVQTVLVDEATSSEVERCAKIV